MLLNENNVNKYNSTGIPKLIFDTAKHQSNVHDVGKNSTSTSNAHSLDSTTASPQEQSDQLLLLLNQAQHPPPKITMLLSKHPPMNRLLLLLQDPCSFGPARFFNCVKPKLQLKPSPSRCCRSSKSCTSI
jgi:hypothetical protein